MKPFPTPNRRLQPLWLLLTCVAFACSCNLSQLQAPPVLPTPAPVTNLTYTPYPTDEPPAGEAPPLLTLAPTQEPPTQKPPTQKPTSTLTELPPPPGGGSWGIVKSDIEVLKIGASSLTSSAKIYVDIRNTGPSEFSGKIHVVCVGTAFTRVPPTTQMSVVSDENIDINIGLGTGFFYTGLVIDPVVYFYPVINCVIEVPDGRDPDTSNNSGTLAIP